MKLQKFLFLIIPLLLLTSCVNKRTNIIVPGHYNGSVSTNELISCDLLIYEITKDEYINENGKNVIRDEINYKHYKLILNINLQNDEIKQINFLNFQDPYNGAHASPIAYVDDNDSWLIPITTDNNRILPASKCCYLLDFNIDNLNLSVYLYYKGE